MRARLATPDRVRCTACRYDGVPDPETHSRVHAAAAMLAAMDARTRQLSLRVQTALASGKSATAQAAMGLVLTLLPAVWLVSAAPPGADAASWLVSLVFCAPSLLALAIGVVLFRQLRRRRSELEQACAAAPPPVAGEPAECHVCGAPLTASSRRAVVRCRHCNSDNLVDPGVLAQAVYGEAVAIGAFQQWIDGRTAELAELGRANERRMVTLGCGLPVLGVGLLLAATIWIFAFVRQPIDGEVEYAAVPAASCAWVGQLVERDGTTGTISFHGNEPPGIGKTSRVDLSLQPPFAAASLVGRSARIWDGTEGRVIEVYSRPILLDSVVIRGDQGKTAEGAIPGLCLLETAEP